MHVKIAPNGSTYLNVGCGGHYSPEWNNIDLFPAADVVGHDLRKALPYGAGVFNAVYSSHVLEHLTRAQGQFFLSEQVRVLKPGGWCRVVVPDLEKIARDYLAQLDKASAAPEAANLLDYDWTVLQFIDQQVREECGGEMLQTLRRGEFNPEFVRSHTGEQFADFLDPARRQSLNDHSSPLRTALRPVKRAIRHTVGLEPPARACGEVHRWMYDRLSLRRLLTRMGLDEFRVVAHDESSIADWRRFQLDTSSTGNEPRKPDSLFVEARKPV